VEAEDQSDKIRRLMVYACCYSVEFKLFKLRREEKRGRKRGCLLDLSAPEFKVSSRSAGSSEQKKKKGEIKESGGLIECWHGDSSLFLPGIKPNRVHRPANQI
jgi:hypothetical protein